MLAVLALALQGWFVLAVLGMHVLRPDLSPVEHRISEYALGPGGAVMTSAFVAAGLATLLLLLGLLRDGPKSWPARWAEVLLKASILGLAVSALFPMDNPGGRSTLPGALHDGARLLSAISGALAAFLLTMSFSLDDRWQPIQGVSLLLALALGVEAALVVRSMGAHQPWGIVSRLHALTTVTWSSATAVRLWAIARS